MMVLILEGHGYCSRFCLSGSIFCKTHCNDGILSTDTQSIQRRAGRAVISALQVASSVRHTKHANVGLGAVGGGVCAVRYKQHLL